jgi:hypothetical protein
MYKINNKIHFLNFTVFFGWIGLNEDEPRLWQLLAARVSGSYKFTKVCLLYSIIIN